MYALESADLPYRQFLEQMGEGALSIDPDRVVLYCNRFFAELVGVPRDQVLGTPFTRFIAPQSSETFSASLAQRELVRVSVTLRIPDGRHIPTQLALTSVGEGPLRRWTIVVTDLTERERMHALSLASEAAQAANLAKDQFLAAVGHELRSPLNAIMGWTQILLERRQKFEPQAQRALEVIERNAKMQAKLIEDLLDVSRVVSGKLHLERVRLDLCEIARSSVASLLPQVSARGIELRLQAGEALHVYGDAQRLQQVLLNLLGNASKFTPKGGIVEVAVQRVGTRARVTVSDTGQGIEPELLPRLFQLFRQGRQRSDRSAAGLGLGLSISKHLLDLHEGSIWAESDGPGRGATFVFELPLCERTDHEQPTRPTNATPFRGLRALLVDDEEDTRELTARVLRNAGAEVVCVVDAASALARIDVERFDFIVSDLMMPGTTGWDLARTIRTRYGTRVPLLAVTSLSGSDEVARARAAGFDAFLTKPLEEQGLLRVGEGLVWEHGRASAMGL